MNPIAQSVSSVPRRDVASRVDLCLRGFFFLTLTLVLIKTLIPISGLKENNWPEALLTLSTTAALLSVLSRDLPAQNVFLGAVIIGGIGGLAQTIGTYTGIPFGPFIFTSAAGPQLFDALSWAIPFLWIIVIYASRGVARLILRPWRKMRVYGFWLIGLTAALSLAFDLGLESYAAHLRHYWMWLPTRFPWHWHGTPLTHFLGWVLTTLIILAFATPALIKKKAAPSLPEYFPLTVWVLLSILFAAGCATTQFWIGAGFLVVVNCVVLTFAIRGAKW